jgi:PKD repeat protein
MGQSSFQTAAIAIMVCLIIAGFISIFGSFNNIEEIESGTGIYGAEGTNSSSPLQKDGQSSVVSRMRILWYDTTSRTYTFRDYTIPGNQNAQTWTDDKLPEPENDTLQRQAAMVRFLEWDGTMERMTGTKYLTDQETVTGILNSYTLIAPPPSVQPGPSVTKAPLQTTPDTTAEPGMLIPTRGQPCNAGDGTITVSFGYVSRHNTPVTLPVGEKNQFSPGDPNRGQPEVFSPGVHPDVFTVSFPANRTNIVWTLMSTVVGAGFVPRLHSEFVLEPLKGYAPLTVRFSDRSTGGTVENRIVGTWDLGDGTVSQGQELTHRYEQPGQFTVTRTVSTACGSETSSETILVYRAMFDFEEIPGNSMKFQFTDQSTGNPAAWFWDFSDGTTSGEQNPVHTWKNPGTYPVGLRVAGEHGSGTAVREVVVPAATQLNKITGN